MWVTFALLVDDSTHNFMRKLALELERAYRVGFRAALLSPHISLKQPFRAANLAAIEAYFDAFAAGIQPFDVMLEAVEVLPAAGGPRYGDRLAGSAREPGAARPP